MPVPPSAPRRLRLINLHTGEKFDGVYRNASGPLAAAMGDLSAFLRDFHSGATIEFDVAVIDFLTAVMNAVGAERAGILSAYRTPETNARLARTTFGVAENSQHLYGRALDVHLDARLADAMRAARSMRRGGVGWYPGSRFLHIDTGPVRNWDREEGGLASLLFDGRRLRPKDAARDDQRYTAELKRSGLPQPGMELSGRIRPELERRSHRASEISRGYGPRR